MNPPAVWVLTKEADVFVRQPDGRLTARFELVKRRLDPYIANGYRDFTLVLDNVPWDLPSEPFDGTYGQSRPPRDLKEWGGAIGDLCKY